MIALLAFPIVLLVAFFLSLPILIQPVEQFEQGPGAAVAYVSLAQQLRAQEIALAQGGQITLRFTEEEWNGLLASAILSGRGPNFPVKRIRSVLLEDGVRLDSIVEPPPGALPSQFQRPIGLQVDLHLLTLTDRALTFEISGLRLGYLTVPNYALRELGPRLGNPLPGLDTERLRLTLPLADLVEAQVKRSVKLDQITLRPGQVILTAEISKQ